VGATGATVRCRAVDRTWPPEWPADEVASARVPKRKTIGFEAPLVEGHKGVTVVIVPFDPREVWGAKPTPLDARREGWLVAGKFDGVEFEGWIGYRWKRFFLIASKQLRDEAKVKVGDTIEVVVAPTTSATALAIAKEQAKLTTAPRKRR
jgi:hypothetical protein